MLDFRGFFTKTRSRQLQKRFSRLTFYDKIRLKNALAHLFFKILKKMTPFFRLAALRICLLKKTFQAANRRFSRFSKRPIVAYFFSKKGCFQKLHLRLPSIFNRFCHRAIFKNLTLPFPGQGFFALFLFQSCFRPKCTFRIGLFNRKFFFNRVLGLQKINFLSCR